MTVSYSADAYSVSFALYGRLLFRFRGSAWKAVYPEVIVISLLYCGFSLLYRLVLEDPWKRYFEFTIIGVARVCDQIPMGFILGFYVTMIYNRFWKQFLVIPYSIKLATLFSTYVMGKTEQAVMLRRMAVRYILLSWTLAYRTMNIPIKKRFPTMRHIVDAGLMTEVELQTFEKLKSVKLDPSYFVPLGWCASLAENAMLRKFIRNPPAVVDILIAIEEYRKALQTAVMYDVVNVSLVYTQAVVIGTYSFFFAGTIGYQFIPMDRYQLLDSDGYYVPSQLRGIDVYVPLVALVQLFVYAGLFKVAESLLNPHGENDDDFELCVEMDKNLESGYLIVTDMHDDLAELIPDLFWDIKDVELPYTEAASRIRERRPNPTSHLGSIFHRSVKHGTGFLTRLAHLGSLVDIFTSRQESSHVKVSDTMGTMVHITDDLDSGATEQHELIQTCANAPESVKDVLDCAHVNQLEFKPVRTDSPLLFADDSDADTISLDGGFLNGFTRRKMH